MSQPEGIIWPCNLCGDWIVQSFHREANWTPEQVRDSFTVQVDAHVDTHMSELMSEIAEVLHGQKPHGSI